LEKLYQNLEVKMTPEKYFRICEQLGKEPKESEIPPAIEDFPEIVQIALQVFNQLGDRVEGDIGYIGKDYSNLTLYMDIYGIEDKEFFIEILSWLDARAIQKSSELMKRELERAKSKAGVK
jgi:hypothetical protein